MSTELTQIGQAQRYTPILSESNKAGSLTVNVGFHSRYLEVPSVEMSTLYCS